MVVLVLRDIFQYNLLCVLKSFVACIASFDYQVIENLLWKIVFVTLYILLDKVLSVVHVLDS